MQIRMETKIGGEVVVRVLAAPGLSDGNLAAILTDMEQDLRWNVLKDAEQVYTADRPLTGAQQQKE